ncbi:hypothetical protein MA16_Dca011186 [Dendrobium catenatum]|uniref:Uncharacterized protein n=1 Tax=Dendrobium catenatum TaxID=906689 RepID=A0A2I0VIJ8_9ASPA|nr:hypothetical protein MA16_Dca011186 [Dendrobium catenatum]
MDDFFVNWDVLFILSKFIVLTKLQLINSMDLTSFIMLTFVNMAYNGLIQLDKCSFSDFIEYGRMNFITGICLMLPFLVLAGVSFGMDGMVLCVTVLTIILVLVKAMDGLYPYRPFCRFLELHAHFVQDRFAVGRAVLKRRRCRKRCRSHFLLSSLSFLVLQVEKITVKNVERAVGVEGGLKVRLGRILKLRIEGEGEGKDESVGGVRKKIKNMDRDVYVYKLLASISWEEDKYRSNEWKAMSMACRIGYSSQEGWEEEVEENTFDVQNIMLTDMWRQMGCQMRVNDMKFP